MTAAIDDAAVAVERLATASAAAIARGCGFAELVRFAAARRIGSGEILSTTL